MKDDLADKTFVLVIVLGLIVFLGTTIWLYSNRQTKITYNYIIEITGTNTSGERIREKILFDNFKTMIFPRKGIASTKHTFDTISTIKAIPILEHSR